MTDRLNSNARAAERGHPLSAREVSAGYGRQTVLAGISLDIGAGKLTALVGPNGCGKSTMLATIARLMKPSAGNVLLEGHDIHVLPTRSVARKLGLLPQSPVVPEGLTVYDLVSRGRHPHQGFLKQWTDKDEQAVRQALEVTDLSDLLHRPVDSLSGGQRQRCWIAMALAQQTPVILLDEPTTYLDLHYQVEVMELLRHLAHDHDRTIVVVLHDLNFAIQYADCVVFLKNGAIRHIAADPGTCTAELIEDVFSVQVIRLTHPQTGKPVFVPAHGTGPIT
ncbi:ABC transporter ATP-binding protein [Rhizobium tumorigenes]|uniref:ABC transporter ATP-binding protein n=1 Tax=Rhizobium tumorigenes TaxID=2041385 RepID=UPI00241D3E06|nr:ABC transporter ATP-binding protein [Rhizobium tumorigenes]WFS04346.1 ABC transporter ATP-binding protein [Rhizobium tumorigenes]